jgi:probable HAF family extracellular repeat protein
MGTARIIMDRYILLVLVGVLGWPLGAFPALGADYIYTELLPPGWTSASATAINNNGDVVGQGRDGQGRINSFLYSNGTYIELLPPGWVQADVNGI